MRRPYPGRLLLGWLLLTVVALTPGCREDGDELYPLQIGAELFEIELAITDQQRQTGLMHREQLPADRGMLFVFDRDDTYGFWMRDTLIPLSIAFIDVSGCVREIHDMRPLSERVTAPAVPVRYALEVNRGAFDRAGLSVGDCIDITGLRERAKAW
ncbi:DUF192 domain-containing protein [Spirochaeta africana]|uniref:DUF192 domain-containing protein n=1 Tax=Spirochaeta africana (strain ATCC 700263 / DSM 8902 / Z-7692) TaxID=889378 RepID=H9UJP6_SPIAZ|nr:DUF192 domain-containing protein [Spirochaeta africana]AFG37739.1 hypothetical protein Spiaf_1682 [Spirochaeta africana DSM 8902]